MWDALFERARAGITEFLDDEAGASALEYAVIAALIAAALIGFLEPVQTALGNVFDGIQSALSGATD